MKLTPIVAILIATSFLLACSTSTDSSISDDRSDPIEPSGEDSVTEELTTDCTAVVDPQIMVAAFPSTFDGMYVVGDIIADSSEETMDDGSVQRGATALKTLTIDDEYYVTFSGTDACGLNVARGLYLLTKPGADEFGWVKTQSVKGYSGLLQYERSNGIYTLTVLLNDRVVIVVTADTENGEADVIRAAEQINFGAIEKAIP